MGAGRGVHLTGPVKCDPFGVSICQTLSNRDRARVDTFDRPCQMGVGRGGPFDRHCQIVPGWGVHLPGPVKNEPVGKVHLTGPVKWVRGVHLRRPFETAGGSSLEQLRRGAEAVRSATGGPNEGLRRWQMRLK